MYILTKIKILMNVSLVRSVPILQFVKISVVLTLVNVRMVSYRWFLIHSDWLFLGYEMRESICEDINECRTGTHLCDANAICDNSMGSYNCYCKEDGNWYGDGFDCYYHDPCWNRSGIIEL